MELLTLTPGLSTMIDSFIQYFVNWQSVVVVCY